MKAKKQQNIDQEQLLLKAKEAGFKGVPLIVEKWKNKNLALTGDNEQDIARGALAIKIGENWQISPAVGPLYFKDCFTKIN